MKRNQITHRMAIALFGTTMALSSLPAAAEEMKRRALEAYPDHIAEKLKQRRLELDAIAPQLVVVKPALRWLPDQTVTVAFKSGDTDLHRRIEAAALEWTKHANIKLDFGFDKQSQTYRSYSSGDDDYAADIRIMFDGDTYWSAVGNDSVNSEIYPAWDASMNLGAIDSLNAEQFQGTVLHEFGHALGAEHEHQNPKDGCDDEWRWDDDAGYVSTTDSNGNLIEDLYYRYPGIYTYMSGAPDYWPRSKVDYNLRQLADAQAYDAGPFDKYSIMKYWFPAEFFYAGENSRCYTENLAYELSSQDKAQIAAIYPRDSGLIAELKKKRTQTAKDLEILQTSHPASLSLKRSIELLSR